MGIQSMLASAQKLANRAFEAMVHVHDLMSFQIIDTGKYFVANVTFRDSVFCVRFNMGGQRVISKGGRVFKTKGTIHTMKSG